MTQTMKLVEAGEQSDAKMVKHTYTKWRHLLNTRVITVHSATIHHLLPPQSLSMIELSLSKTRYEPSVNVRAEY